MDVQINSSTGLCSSCPIRHYGLCPALSRILSEQLETHSLRQISLPTKNYLYQQGELNHGNYILKQGWILLSRISQDGTRQVLRSILPGDFLGFQPDFKGPHIDSAITLTDSVICIVPDLETICQTHSELAFRLVWVGACDMILTETYLANISKGSAKKRIAFMALELYQRLLLRDMNRGYSIPFPLLQEDIADLLGLTPIHVNRTLKKLAAEGILKIEKHQLTILDYDVLYAMVGSLLEPLETCDIAKELSSASN